MLAIKLNTLATGTWCRDCKLRSLQWSLGSVGVVAYKDSDSSTWRIDFLDVVAYRAMSWDVACGGIVADLPDNGGFFEIFDSPWIAELKTYRPDALEEKRHFVFCCYSDIMEIAAKNFILSEVKQDEKLCEREPLALADFFQ